jgi:hypothetical protein
LGRSQQEEAAAARDAGGSSVSAASVLKVVASTTSVKPVGSVLARDATGPRQRAINTGRVVDYVKTDGVKVRVTPLLLPVRRLIDPGDWLSLSSVLTFPASSISRRD